MRTADLSDDEEARRNLAHLYMKFRDKHGNVNIHLAYQAAHFIDWWCWYLGVDSLSQNWSKSQGSRRINQQWEAEQLDYIKFRGKPPRRLHQEYSKYAFENFWISNQFWNSPGAPIITTSAEENLTAHQQDIIDDLWWEFKNTGTTAQEKGYLLNEIPARLHTDWNQSALLDREDAPASSRPRSEARPITQPNATTAVDAGIGLLALAPPVSPPSPGYHPRDDSPEPAYRSNEPGTSSASGMNPPSAVKSSPPVPVYPWTPKPIGAKARSLPRTDPEQATFASTDIRLRMPNVSRDSNIESTRHNARDRSQRRERDTWN